VFCPLAAQRFELSTLRADRSFCRPTGAPGPPGTQANYRFTLLIAVTPTSYASGDFDQVGLGTI
jgi:hypothetical protein